MDLSEAVYELTKKLPKEETYGLTSQLRRAIVSIPANIAEGNGRESAKEYLRHLSFAIGSLCEVDTFLLLTVRLNYLSQQEVTPIQEKLEEEGRMLRGLQKSLRRTTE